MSNKKQLIKVKDKNGKWVLKEVYTTQNSYEVTEESRRKAQKNRLEQINNNQQKKVNFLKKKVEEEKTELGIYDKYKNNIEKNKQNLFISSQDRIKHYTNKNKNSKTLEEEREENFKKIQKEKKAIDKENKKYETTSKTYKNYEEEKNKSYLTQYLADQERVENEKVTTFDKLNILRPYLASLEDALDSQHEYRLDNGSKVSLPTYNELKSAKVQSELGKFGQAIHSASSSLGANTPAMITSMATSAIPYVGKPLSRVTGGAMTYATIYNSAKNRKLLEGYNEEEAENYAKVNASLETGLGIAIGGFSKAIGGNGSILTKNLAKVSDKVLKNEGTKYFVSHLVAEEVEELTQMVLDPINEHVTLGEHKNIKEALSTIDKDEATITALSTLFSIGLTEGPTALNINTLSKNIDAINKQYGTDFRIKTDSNQVVDSKTNKDATARFEELRRQSKMSKYQEQQITELETRAMQVESDYETGKITEEQYKEETQKISYEAKLFKQEQENNILNPITKIEVEKEILDEKFNSNQITEQEYDKQVAELDNKLKEIAGKEDNTKYSQNENQVPYQYEKSDNIKVDNLKQSASQYFDNAEDTHELINTYEKIIVDKNYNVLFDDTITNIKGESVNAKITTLENGEVEIRINPNSERAGEFLIMHEVTHAIETDSLKQLVVDFAKQNKDFDKALTDLKQTYGTEDVSSEVLADISGQLLGNQEFINILTMQNTQESKNIIKQIYESIVRTLNKLTTKGRYRNFVKDLETKWREAYQTQENNLKGETKLSTIGIKGAENLSKSDVKREYKNLYKNQEIAKNIFENSKKDLENTNIITKRNTGWFKTKYGDWGTLISDKNAKLTKKLETNKTYRLGDIFEHDLLYKAYPKLKNLKVETCDFGEKRKRSYGAYNKSLLSEKIYLNNFWVENLGDFKGTLLHEINHYIQAKEKFDKRSRGAVLGELNRNNNLGEIISHEAKIYSEFTQEELNDIILPELAKNNPEYENIKKLVLERNYVDFKSKLEKREGKGIYDYETDSYVKEKNERSSSEKIRETIGNKDVRTNRGRLKYDSELDNSSFYLKQKQLNIILKNNPVNDDYHTWIRNIEDIKTFEETLKDPDWSDYVDEGFNPDFTGDIVKEALNKGKITVYSSYPIEQGIFVSPSRMEAESYSGNGKVYSKEVNLTDVAWIDPTQGQYAKVSQSKYSKENKTWQEHIEENYKATGTRTNFSDIRQKAQETNTTEVSKVIEPVINDIKTISDELKSIRKELGLKESKVLNPNTIANITKEDANTTPKLPNKKVSIGEGKSKFADNIMNKANMLEDTSKEKILSQDEVKYYEKVTNKESLDKAFTRLENGGASETMSWLNKESKNADSTDVAEGWILMKQYQDNKDYDGMVQVAKKLREIGTKAGQTVQAFNIMERMTPEGMVKYAQSELETAYENMIKNKSQEWIESNRDKFDLTPSEVEFIMDNMQEVSTMEDGYNKKVKLAEIQKLMTDKLPPEKGAGIKAWMRISMLFNPKTQVRNILGNAIVAPVNMVGDTFASMVDRVVSKKTGVRTTGMTKLSNYGKGMKEGLYQSYNDFKKGINTRNIEGNRFEIGEGKSFNDKRIMGKALNRVDNMLSFMLDAGDRTFYEASFTNSINNQLVLNKTDVITQNMIDIATTEALQRTWQDNNNFTKFVLRTRKGLNNLIGTENFGLGDVLIPFAKTPANLTKALIDYSPAGVIGAITSGINLKRSLNNGQYTAQMQHKFVQNLGRATAGTMLYVLGYSLAKSGVIGGEADDDKDVANFMKNTLGISNYSIKIGDKSFTYDWAQPVAGAFSTMANIINSQNKEQALLESIVGNLDTAGAILLEQSFLQSINEVLNNQDGAISGLVTQVLELPSRAIPTFSKQIADLLDKTQRTSFEKGKPIQTAVNQVKAKIPGLSKTLAPSVDTLGREIQKYGGNNSVFNVFFNPANVNSKNVSESAKEIYRLYQTTGNKQLMPRVAPYDIEIEGKKRLLTSTERANYQKQSGKIVENSIKELLKSSTYKKLSDEDKTKTITDIINYAYNKPQENYGKSIASEYKNADKYVEKGGTISGYYCINNILKSYETDYEDAKDNLNSNSANYSAQVEKLSAIKRENIINAIINTNVNKEAKAYLYGKYYGNPETINSIVNSGINFNEYLKFVRKEYTSDKDSKGETIKNSRKKKVFKAVEGLKLTVVDKAMLIRTEYPSYDDYNYEIIQHVNKLSLTKTEKKAIFETLGFEIKGGKIYW